MYIYIYMKSFVIHDIISRSGTSSSIESLRIFLLLFCPPTSAVHECADLGVVAEHWFDHRLNSGYWLNILFLKAILPGVSSCHLIPAHAFQDSALVLSISPIWGPL